jgi:DNA-binding NarL/FixJ family response regulator
VARLQAAGADVVIFDLSDAAADGVQAATSLAQRGLLGNVRTVGVYAHVEAGVRERAQQAGFDLVVPRSRMAREGAQLVSGLLAARERPANVQDEG